MICERCQGSGKHKIVDNKKWGWYIFEKCNLCDGHGETDWISEIFDEKQTKSPTSKKLSRNHFYYMDYLRRVYPTKTFNCNFYALDNYFEPKEET